MGDRHQHRWLAATIAGGVGAALLVAASTGTEASTGTHRTCHPDRDAGVIADWNATAVATIAVDAAKSPAESYVYFGFTHAAMHNAVNGITRQYQLYKWHQKGPRCASPEAAAASAAYELLRTYFPASQARLDAALAASLAGVEDGWAEDAGVAYGAQAAARIVQLRVGDGRDAAIQFTMPPAPGVWRPTATPPVPFSTPWLGQMKPMVMDTSDEFRPGPPPALTSKRYAREFNEVKRLGGSLTTPNDRTAEQTRTAMFFSDIGLGGLQGALRDLVTRRQLDISAAARVFAIAEVAACDGFVSTWDTKFHYGFWRPVTAIQLADSDNNPATTADPMWASLIPSPPYPDYTSGLNTAVGSISRAVAHVLGGNRVDLNITSVAAAETRHYPYAGRLNHEAIAARIWSGLHFRTADVKGNHIAQRIATLVYRTEFRPVG